MSTIERAQKRLHGYWGRFARFTPLGQSLAEVERIAIERLGIRPTERVLDVGCGDGHAIRLIASWGGFAYGVDLSQEALRSARENVAARGQLVRGDAGSLPFKSGVFDKVVCLNNFHLFENHPRVLLEIRRVLRPGGLMVLVDPRADSWGARLGVDVLQKKVFGLTNARIYSRREWEELLRQVGFTAADVRCGPLWRPVAYSEVFVEAKA